MSQGKNVAIVLLSVTAGITAFWAWRAETELATLQARSAPPPAIPKQTQRSDLPANMLDSPEPKGGIGAVNSTSAGPDSAKPDDASTERRNIDEQHDLRESPEFQRLQSLARQGVLDIRYADLFRKLNLPPDLLQKLKDLLLEKQNIRTDVFTASRREGLSIRNDRELIDKLIQENESENEAALRSLLGESGYDTYLEHESNQVDRAIANRLDRRLSYTATPLSETQNDQLVALITAERVAQKSQPSAWGTSAAADQATLELGIPSQPLITDSVIAQARGFLTPAQVEVLTQFQAELNAGMEMARLMREQGARRRP
ncbi:MAG: hypothetical protein H7A44_12670 [Opitutaceae bacterium]|nr:hypothetical protein [Cephaloticoccus sp.]MCP5531277.1 hypothetical protein [Opitutaceae bacterium]